MIEPTANERQRQEGALTERFLESPDEHSFADVFKVFMPQLVAFFRARGCEQCLAEDLTQEVMLTVHRKARQIRDRALFRAWLFKIARNKLCRHYDKRTREVETICLDDAMERVLTANRPAVTLAFEFLHWMAFLDSQEREVMTLRFVEQWEYHEIAAAKSIPIGTVQWRVFNAKKKLASYLVSHRESLKIAA